jgi:hypothetical protein
MVEQQLRTTRNDLLTALRDPFLDEETRELMLMTVKEIEERLEASWDQERAS